MITKKTQSLTPLAEEILEQLTANTSSCFPRITISKENEEAFDELKSKGFVKENRLVGFQIISCEECCEVKMEDELDGDELCSNCIKQPLPRS